MHPPPQGCIDDSHLIIQLEQVANAAYAGPLGKEVDGLGWTVITSTNNEEGHSLLWIGAVMGCVEVVVSVLLPLRSI